MSVTLSQPSITQANPNSKHLSISDLPPELVLQIYTHLPTPSSITSLNLTSRYIHQIWYKNASSISGSVLSHSIAHYDTALELRELDRLINHSVAWKPSPEAARIEFLARAQKQAREHVAEARRKGYRGPSSSRVLLRTITNKNKEILCNARTAVRACMLYEQAASQGASATGTDPGKLTERGEILGAYYGIWIVGILGSGRVPRERLEATSKKELEGMVAMARYLVFDCTDDEKYALGISRPHFRSGPEGFEEREGTWMCNLDLNWWFALWAIIEVSRDVAIAAKLRE